MTAIKFITDLLARGRCCFSTQEAVQALGTSMIAARAALRRLRKKGEITMPYKGFYVIVPPEYRIMGCLPAPHFIPFLMEHLGEKYYAGLLSAGEYHGAAHQRPQVYQVVTARNRPQINCGRVRVQFIARKNMEQIPTSDLMTPHGYLKVSTPAATAFDLVGYSHSAAGMDNVATVLAELAECIDGKDLVAVAAFSPIAWAQRLGYLLELVGAEDKTGELADYIAREKPAPTPLVPSQPFRGIRPLQRWRLLVNDTVESDV
jgi:predicted transcriptional regulator of viral defense system